MGDVALVAMVGIVCFALAAVVLGVLALFFGRIFVAKATKDGVDFAAGEALKAPATPSKVSDA